MTKLEIKRCISVWNDRSRQILMADEQEILELAAPQNAVEIPRGSYTMYVKSACFTSNTIHLQAADANTVRLQVKTRGFLIGLVTFLIVFSCAAAYLAFLHESFWRLGSAAIVVGWGSFVLLSLTVWRHKMYALEVLP